MKHPTQQQQREAWAKALKQVRDRKRTAQKAMEQMKALRKAEKEERQ